MVIQELVSFSDLTKIINILNQEKDSEEIRFMVQTFVDNGGGNPDPIGIQAYTVMISYQPALTEFHKKMFDFFSNHQPPLKPPSKKAGK
jgi:hypothetical protein